MSAQLQGIQKYCQNNLPGIKSFQYAPFEWFSSLPLLIQNDGTIKGDFVFTVNDWLNAVVINSVNKYGLTIKNKRSSFGNPKQVLFSGIIVSDNELIQSELSSMEQYRFILKVIDKNDRIRILGTLDQPLSFKFSYSNKGNKNRYKIEFKGIMPHTPFIYTT